MTTSVHTSVPASIRQIMEEIGLYSALLEIVEAGTQLWLSGGALRDGFFDYHPSDFDFTTSVAPSKIANDFSARVSGSCFMLDEERLQYRVAWTHQGQRYTADFAPLRGSDISADLRDRDFTLNAMAWDLTSGCDELFDPLDGLSSLRSSELKMCSRGAFENDPVRTLRGVRLAATHRLTIDKATFAQMRVSGQYLKYSPGERLRDELVKLFSADCAGYLEQLRMIEIDGMVFGHALDASRWFESLAAVESFENHLRGLSGDSFPVLHEMATTRINDDIKRQTFLKLCSFFRVSGLPQSDWFNERLRLSRRNCELLARLAVIDINCVDDLENVADNSRSRALWAAELDADPASALFFLALLRGDDPATKILEQVASDWLSHSHDGRVSALMNGEDVRTLFSDISGPQIGTALRLLQQAEIVGEVDNAESAAAYLLRNREKVFDIEFSNTL